MYILMRRVIYAYDIAENPSCLFVWSGSGTTLDNECGCWVITEEKWGYKDIIRRQCM